MTSWLLSNYSSERMRFKFTVNIKIFMTVRCSEADVLRLIFPFDKETNTLHVAVSEIGVIFYVIPYCIQDAYRADMGH